MVVEDLPDTFFRKELMFCLSCSRSADAHGRLNMRHSFRNALRNGLCQTCGAPPCARVELRTRAKDEVPVHKPRRDEDAHKLEHPGYDGDVVERVHDAVGHVERHEPRNGEANGSRLLLRFVPLVLEIRDYLLGLLVNLLRRSVRRLLLQASGAALVGRGVTVAVTL